jgi:hypothetical protein
MKTSYLLLAALALLPTVALSAAETALTPAPVGLAPSNPDPAALEAAFLRALLPIDQLVRDATAELIETVVEEKPFPESDTLLQAFLAEPIRITPAREDLPLRSCTKLREERRRVMGALYGMKAKRRAIETSLNEFRRRGGRSPGLREEIGRQIGELETGAEELRRYYDGINRAEPDRIYTYHLRLHGARARSLEAYYETSPEVKLLRVRFGTRGWMNFPTESYAVHEGLLGPPTLEADGVTWTLRRKLTPFQACTRNLGFALEYLTRWAPRPGTPGNSERGVTVRTHAWIYGQ